MGVKIKQTHLGEVLAVGLVQTGFLVQIKQQASASKPLNLGELPSRISLGYPTRDSSTLVTPGTTGVVYRAVNTRGAYEEQHLHTIAAHVNHLAPELVLASEVLTTTLLAVPSSK